MPHTPDNKLVLLITGAASGIGAAVAEEAVARGHRVLLTDIDETAAQATARRLGAGAVGARLDIRDPEGWTRAFDLAEHEFGAVDVLVNNAGIIHTGRVRDLTLDQHRDVVSVNLLGTITGVYTALDRMTRRGRGHIINICSMTSFLPLPGYATYGGTKHAIRAFHHSVALEEREGPLEFTIVHPPSTRTGMLAREIADPASAAFALAEKSHAPAEIAKAVVDAIAFKPVEVVFPPLAGRVQRAAGAFPRLMRWVIPRAEARGNKKRDRLLRTGKIPAAAPTETTD